MTLPIRSLLVGCVCLFAFCSESAGQQVAGKVAPASGKAMCSALTPADFTRAGVPVSVLAEANLGGNEGAYCVYRSTAGKVEFDIFFPAGATAKEVLATEETVLGEGLGKSELVQFPGADAAHLTLSTADQPASSCIVVRKGNAVFDILIPRSARARQQLLDLAQIVLGRLKL